MSWNPDHKIARGNVEVVYRGVDVTEACKETVVWYDLDDIPRWGEATLRDETGQLVEVNSDLEITRQGVLVFKSNDDEVRWKEICRGHHSTD